MNRKSREKQVRERALVIHQVQAGVIPATEGAQRLRLSRKTYYKWENKVLEATASVLENGRDGRPGTAKDMQKIALEQENRELKKKLDIALQTIEVRDLLRSMEERDNKKNERDQKKKISRKKRR